MSRLTKIQKNPGLRTLAKMMLNSMWGKFSQNPNKTQVVELIDPVKFHEFHKSDRHVIRYVSALTEERMEIHYKHQVEDDPVRPKLKHLRGTLYDLLGASPSLQSPRSVKRMCGVWWHGYYCLHPSSGFARSSSWRLPRGLQRWVEQWWLHCWICIAKGKEGCKVRGLSLNSEGSRQMNYQVLRQNVLDDIQNPLEVGGVPDQRHQDQWLRPWRQTVRHRDNPPSQAISVGVYNKHVVDPTTFQTYPYGYVRYTP